MKERLEGAVYRCEHWTHAPRGTEYTFRWSAFAEGDGVGDNLQLLSACLKDGLGWQKVPRGSAMFKDLQDGLRSFCDVNGLELLQEECEAQENGAIYELETPAGSEWIDIERNTEEQPAPSVKRVHFYTGYLSSNDLGHVNGRLQVDFAVAKSPDDPEPTQQEEDAAFMCALAQQMHIYQEIVHSNGVKTDYSGSIESDDGCIEVSFTCSADASVEEKDVAHLASMAQKAQFNWVELGRKIVAPVVVVGHNASGVPDSFFVDVMCSQDQYGNGDHYDLAKEHAEAEGFDPAIAFDANDEAWKTFDWKAAGTRELVDADSSQEQAYQLADEPF